MRPALPLLLLAAASNAVALATCAPLVDVVVSHAQEYGEVVAVHFSTPSTLNSTRFTPTLSLAVAARATRPAVNPSNSGLRASFEPRASDFGFAPLYAFLAT